MEYVSFNKDFKWIIPVVRNKKKIYNVDLNPDDDVDILNDVTEEKDAYILTEYLKRIKEYNTNEVPEGHNKYYFLISSILKLFQPYDITIKKDNILKEDFVNENIDVLLDNINDFDSYTISVEKIGKEEKNIIKMVKFLFQRYSKGLTKTFLPDKFAKNYILEPLTLNDKLSLKGYAESIPGSYPTPPPTSFL